MAKIPRIEKGQLPNTTPGGGAPSFSGFSAPAEAAAKLTGTAFDIAAGAERAEAEKLRRILEQKQAIVNEVDAGRRAGDYEEDLVRQSEELKKAFWDAPEKAPEQLLTAGRLLADRQIEQAPNTQVGYELAQRSNARLAAAMREMHDWAQARQTQKAKGDLSIIVNRATAGAEVLSSVGELGRYIADKEKELRPLFEKVLGPSESQTKLAEMRRDMARGWALVAGDRNPLGVLGALKTAAAGNPLVDNLDVSDREALRSATKTSFEGLTRTRELEAIMEGIDGNRKIAEAFLSGTPEFAGLVFSQRRALEEQKKIAKAQMRVDTDQLQELGVDLVGYEPADIPALIDKRLEFINALDRARRRQISFTAPDDPASVDGLMVQMDKAIRAKKGKDLAAIVEQQKNVAVALSDERISGTTAATMFKTMSLAMEKAAEKQEGLWGPNTAALFRAPREAGIVELNRQLGGGIANLMGGRFQGGQFAGLDARIKTAIRLNYEGKFNAALENQETVTQEKARRLALRAIAEETGTRIPGAE